MSVGQRVGEWRAASHRSVSSASLGTAVIMIVLNSSKSISPARHRVHTWAFPTQTASSLVARTVTIGVYNLHNAI